MSEEKSANKRFNLSEPYLNEIADILAIEEVDASSGLTTAEANRRIEEYGANELKAEEKVPMWKRFAAQFNDVMVWILIAASILSGVLGEWLEAGIILAIVIINAVLGVMQEGKAADAVAALQDMSSPNARVIRDGQQTIIKSDEVVPGDILILEAGDIVPADARLVESSNMKADESALTGESVAVEKDARFTTSETVGIGDRDNMVFSSTPITYGNGKAVVTNTGQTTEMGKIADRLTTIEEDKTPLQKNLDQLGVYLAILVTIVIVITFIVGILGNGNWLDMLRTAVALGVAAIPEGMSAVVTIVLAIGMNRMAEENAIVKKLLAVETLGSVNYIASDKTGTLTKNEMTVTKIFANDGSFEVSGGGYDPRGIISSIETNEEVDETAVFDRLMAIAVLCNEAELIADASGRFGIIGDPTEGAMLSVAAKYGVTRKGLQRNHKHLGDLPFDSDRKMMSVFYDNFSEGKLSLTKGAPDIVLDLCTHEMTENGVVEMTDARREELLEQNSTLAKQALRVLSFAYKVHADSNFDDAEQGMVFTGFMGMIDPARPEARESISIAHNAGIKVVMITGDHKDTAQAIAHDLGLMQEGDTVLTGAELEVMSDDELREAATTATVYARVSPEHKVRIVEGLQANGNIVSMTGDGVNDAPALKRADIGVAMGITGTEVSKNAADMILTDDNFSTIVSAVEEGRVIYSNIRKFVGFLLSCNIGEVLVIFISMLVLGPDMLPLLPIQLLWLNLVTDSFPALALGQEEGEPDIMDQKPREKNAKILDREMLASISVQAVAIFLAVFLAFLIGLNNYGIRMLDSDGEIIEDHIYMYDYSEGFSRTIIEAAGSDHVDLQPVDGGVTYEYNNGYFVDGEQVSFQPAFGALTYAFVTLVFAELLRAYSNRSEHYSILQLGFFSNTYMNRAVVLSGLLTLAIVYIPGVNTVFGTSPMTIGDWGWILLLSFIPLVVGELFKLIYYRGARTAKREKLEAAKAKR